MIVRLSQVILNFIYRHSELSREMNDIYQYGIEITLSSALNIMLVIGFSVLITDIPSGVIFLLLFVSMRSFTGGYHASTYFRCNSIMLLTFLTVYLLYRNLCQLNIDIHIYEALLLLNLMPILVFAPVPNKHKKLSQSQMRFNHIVSVIMGILLSLTAFILILFKIRYGVLIVMTISSISVMIIIESLLQRREYHEC